MLAHITPAPIGGSITAPPSKSMAHRGVLCAGLARGLSRIYNLDLSKDIRVTLNAVAQMGAKVKVTDSYVDIEGKGGFATILQPVDCHESGSSLRFLIPILSLTGQQVEFTGRPRLFQRPLDVYQHLFDAQGLLFAQTDHGLTIKGSILPTDYTLAGNVSSQFISGLLFSLPLLHHASTIAITPPFESRSYVELTLSALRDFGIKAQWSDTAENTLCVAGRQRYINREYTIEGDYSQAAFFAVLGAVCGGISVDGLRPDSLQGDAAILPILQRCGARFTRKGDRVTFEKSELTATEIDLADCPDLGPILMVLGLFCKGETVIRNAGRLRIKESDRIASMQQELAKFGGKLHADETTVTVQGGLLTQPVGLCGHNDHRVVMSLAVAGLCAGVPVCISEAEAVGKSWPGFFAELQRVGAGVEVSE